jgi:hypothetical protein
MSGNNETYLGLHIFPRFYTHLDFLNRFSLKSFILNLNEIPSVGAAVMHANRRTGRQTEGHDEANSRFSLLWERLKELSIIIYGRYFN